MPNSGITDLILLRLSFGMAGFIFELVLLILHAVLGYGEKDKNIKFQILIVVVAIGNVISILDNLFRVSGAFNTPDIFKTVLKIVSLLFNVYLTYYVYSYLRTFIKDKEAVPKACDVINYVIVFLSTAFALALVIVAVIQLSSGAQGEMVPNYARIIIGYVVELYFLIFSMIMVIRFRKQFGKRAFFTAMGAYAVIIAAIGFQFVQTKGILLNYFGAAIGSYIFYIGAEIPDYKNLKKSLEVVQTLAEAIDAKDRYTNGHSSRVAAYSKEIARRAGYSDKAQQDLYMMGLLHDVGKIGVHDAVINKPGKLTPEEFEEMKKHPVIGAKILETLTEMPYLKSGARWHHERYDGNGYPDGLKGDEIPVEARIIAVADAYDAMTSNRRYRARLEQDQVREQFELYSGTQFDPNFAKIMLKMIKEDKNYEMRELTGSSD